MSAARTIVAAARWLWLSVLLLVARDHLRVTVEDQRMHAAYCGPGYMAESMRQVLYLQDRIYRLTLRREAARFALLGGRAG